MASSSSHKSFQDYNDLIPCQPQQVVKAGLDGEEDEDSWLQLGLGLGLGSSVVECKTQQHRSNPPLSSSEKTQFQAHHNHDDHIGLGLGLGLEEEIRQGGVLGFGYNEASVREIDLPMPAATINYDHQSLWTSSTNYYHFDDHDHENMPSSWQMDDSEEDGSCFLGVHDHQQHHHDWQMPVPNSYQYHHCYSTSSSSMRPNSGLWFTLCASTNREGEGLPQIPKAYIRVKDENVTVSMVKKYLVTKLGLSNEAEIDVYCMGQKLLHTQSLKQVRDGVWLPKLVESVNSSALSFEDFNHTLTCHLLSLHYGTPSL